MNIAENLRRVTDGIAEVCHRVGRNPAEIALVAVSKTVDAARVAEAIGAGVTDLGENWVQEALPKRPAVEQLEPRRVRWHMIGHLQTNKVKKALEVFDSVQGVDSLHLAQELDRRAAQSGRVLPVLLEVNTSGEASKFGIAPEGLPALGEAVRGLAQIRLEGLMTIGPGLSVEDPEKSRPCFKLLRDLRSQLERELGMTLPVLSMGMSSDYGVAIEEGSTMLRVGTAIFGARQ